MNENDIALLLLQISQGIYTMNEQSVKLASQVTATGAAHLKAVDALTTLVTEVAALNTKLSATYAGNVSVEDTAAIEKAIYDLNASTVKLIAATPGSLTTHIYQHPILDKVEEKIGEVNTHCASAYSIVKGKFKLALPYVAYYSLTVLGGACLFAAGFLCRHYFCN